MSLAVVYLGLFVCLLLMLAIGACLNRIYWEQAPYEIRVKLNKKRRARRRRIQAIKHALAQFLRLKGAEHAR